MYKQDEADAILIIGKSVMFGGIHRIKNQPGIAALAVLIDDNDDDARLVEPQKGTI
ncbi:hypothetical protein [Paraburkholderia susongensis]|uniref:Uncharacterized protein n=1 Tax=Paraburkholderia susongensis TaxID=1515439 RepID=A0A1X7LYS9_9BURK|nr:hypothetical protein [Paraburkholderia susongensis]SMG58870.1 hypothetical protein SAMN06265784_11216 [Paraburkholderia susongensis]